MDLNLRADLNWLGLVCQDWGRLRVNAGICEAPRVERVGCLSNETVSDGMVTMDIGQHGFHHLQTARFKGKCSQFTADELSSSCLASGLSIHPAPRSKPPGLQRAPSGGVRNRKSPRSPSLEPTLVLRPRELEIPSHRLSSCSTTVSDDGLATFYIARVK